jgi:hypothetical protein
MVLGAMQLDERRGPTPVLVQKRKFSECISVLQEFTKNVQDRSQAPYVTSASPSWQPHHSAGGHEGQAEVQIHNLKHTSHHLLFTSLIFHDSMYRQPLVQIARVMELFARPARYSYRFEPAFNSCVLPFLGWQYIVLKEIEIARTGCNSCAQRSDGHIHTLPKTIVVHSRFSLIFLSFFLKYICAMIYLRSDYDVLLQYRCREVIGPAGAGLKPA